MDPEHSVPQNPEEQENILHGMINENEDVTKTFLNESGEGDESLNRGDGSGEVEAEAWNREEEGEADEGVADGSGRNSGEVCITIIEMQLSIYIHACINTLFILLAFRVEHFFRKNETRPNTKVGCQCEVPDRRGPCRRQSGSRECQ